MSPLAAASLAAFIAAGSADAAPLYRMYSDEGSDHFYTLSWAEVLRAAGAGYAYEGVTGYMGVTTGCPG